jgi:hypothetical protein
MEKIRTYDLADLSRAVRFKGNLPTRQVLSPVQSREKNNFFESALNHLRKRSRQEEFISQPPDSKDDSHNHQEKDSIDLLVTSMHTTHAEWVDKKLAPSIAYLQKGKEKKSEDEVKEKVLMHYKDGLSEAVFYSARENDNDIDAQDAIVGYTAGFVTMLRTCERLDVRPDSALLFAKNSYDMGGRKLAQILTKYPDTPKIVIDRASEHHSPEGLLSRYGKTRNILDELSGDERCNEIPQRQLIHIALESRNTEEALGFLFRNRRGFDGEEERRDRVEPKISKVEDVPRLEQKFGNWCGLTSLSMVLQHWGYSELVPEKIYEHIYGGYDELLENMDHSRGPSVDTLALAAQELTTLKVDLWTEEKYEKLRQKNADRTPHDVLRAYIMKREVPCIVRVPGHFKVAVGIDTANNEYIFNDPLGGRERVRTAESFEAHWAEKDARYLDIRDSSHLILAIYPQADKKKE